MTCKDMMIWIGTSYSKIDCGLKDLAEDCCYHGPRGGLNRCYVHEAEYRGCCRVVPQPISWAVPGETRVFLVHSEGCKEAHQGAVFGYFLLERFEIVVDPATYESLSNPDQIPWSDELFQNILQTVREEHASKPFKRKDIQRLEELVNEQFEKRHRKFAQQVTQGQVTFRKTSGPSQDELLEDLIQEIFEEVLGQLVESILKEKTRDWVERALRGQDGVGKLLNCLYTAGEEARFCSPPNTRGFPPLAHKRTNPGAIYLVDPLTALITDLFFHALNEELEDPSRVEKKDIRQKEIIFKRVVEQAHEERAQEHYQKRNAMKGLPPALGKRVVQRGQLVLFPRPFPVIQRWPKASFRGYLRADGDGLLAEVTHSLQEENYLVKVPYCTGPKGERPMTKAQLQAHFAGELRINKEMMDRFFEVLLSKASEDIRQVDGFVLPGFGRFYLKSDGQIAFYAYKPLRDAAGSTKANT